MEPGVVPGPARRQSRLRRDLVVDAPQRLVHAVGEREVHVERRIRRRVDECLWLALVLVGAEEVQPVPDDRAAQRAARLLVRVGKDALGDEVLRVELVVPEVAANRAGKGVCAGLGDRVHDHARGAPLRRVKPVGDDLELRDRVAAPVRLLVVAAGVIDGRDLLAVDVGLRIALPVLHVAARFVAARPRRQQRKVHPVAAVDGQFLHLPRVDVGAHGGLSRIDERGLTGNGHCFLKRGRGELDVQTELLSQGAAARSCG